MYTLPAAPLSIGGILDDGFRLFRTSWRQLLPVAIVVSLISSLPQLLISGLGQIKPGEAPSPVTLGTGAVVTFVLIILLSTVSWAVMLAGVDLTARTGSASMGEAFRVGLRRSPAVIGTSLLAMLAIMGGLILLVIPAFYLMVALYPAFLLPVAEKLGPRQSLRRAYALVKGSWWRTAGVLTVLTLILTALFAIVSVIAGVAMVPFVDQTDAATAANSVMMVQVVVSIVLAPLLPLTYCVMYAVYTDLRLRKDGSDLLQRVAGVGA